MLRTTLLSIATVVCAAQAPAVQGPTADQIVSKHLQAIGGTEALKTIKTMRITGKTIAGPGMEMPLAIEIKKPSMMRVEITAMGQSIIQVFNGKDSWMVNPMMGSTDPMPMPAEMAAQSDGQASQFEGPLAHYKDRGATLDVLGKEKVDGADAFKLKLTEKGGQENTLFMDADSYLVSKITSKTKIQGTDVTVTVKMGDYKATSGVMFAHSLNIAMDGFPMGNQQMSLDKIEVNPAIDESRFVMPKKAPAPAPEAAPAPKQ